MTVSVDLVIDDDIFAAINAALERTPRTVKTLVDRSIRGDVEARVLPLLQKEPGKPSYPIAWQTERQRRAYFATNGFGAGIPYRRTHALAQGWRLVWKVTDGGGVIRVENPANVTRYVYGPNQQRFHALTGWMSLADIDDIVLDESVRAQDMLIVGWYSIVEDVPGVKLI